MSRSTRCASSAVIAWVALSGGISGCTQEMAKEGHLRPFENAPPLLPPDSTIARGQLSLDIRLSEGYGLVHGKKTLVQSIPLPVTRELLNRGRQRYDIYCAACHGFGGDGDGMIVQRGFLPPPSYHVDRLKRAPAGHFFEVITNGFGAMYSYADRVDANDRWAIVAYIRALQLSRAISANELSLEDRKALGE